MSNFLTFVAALTITFVLGSVLQFYINNKELVDLKIEHERLSIELLKMQLNTPTEDK